MKHVAVGRLQRAGCRSCTGYTGYTLVETVIVLVVLGVIAALGFPRFSLEIRHQRINQAAGVVAADLELAGSLAAARRQPIELRFDPAAAGYTLTVRDSSRALLRRSLGTASDYRLEAFSPSAAVVHFFPGGTVSAPLTVAVGAPDYQRTVSVTRAGLVRVRP